jgi:hypothetical protein
MMMANNSKGIQTGAVISARSRMSGIKSQVMGCRMMKIASGIQMGAVRIAMVPVTIPILTLSF